MSKARYIMIGGFLGAGKTTAILKLAEHLRDAGKRVGLITNDQSVGLVDTALLASHGFATEEITGGCFCCRFNSLTDAADRLTESSRPEVFIAEPVGSCTDLKASVSYPLRRMYGDSYSVAPLTVLVDPVRAERILGLAEGKAFTKKVVYVYEKQLEEAEVIVVNKIDLLTPERRARLAAALAERFPKARVVEASARTGDGLTDWFDLVAGGADLGSEPAMDVDYALYAEGEALLGWLNCTAELTADAPVDGNALLRSLAARVHARLVGQGAEIAHLKMTLTPAAGSDIAVANLVRSDGVVELSHELAADVDAGELIVNLRAEADPAALKAAVEEAIEETVMQAPGLLLGVRHLEHFRPGKPEPTHRFAEA
ncbi:MAG: cobalamin biosynthesis protein [Phycisphaerales bacterium]|nr:cobalamin biosynthesis protein [Phycisphaerales bacterium]